MKPSGFINTILIGGMLALSASAQSPAPLPNPDPAREQSPASGPRTLPDQDRTMPDRERTNTDRTGTTTDKATKPDTDHSGHTAGAAGEGSAVGKQDHEFMKKAAMGSMMEVQVATLAEEKASSAEVKEYARKLRADHEKANEKLKAIAEQRGVALPTDMGKHQQQIDKLNNLSGNDFDRAFMKMQVSHHKKDVKEFQKQADRGMDSAVKEFASAQVPILEGHLRQAEQLASTSTRARKAEPMHDTDSSSSSSSTSTDTKTKPNKQQ